MILELVDRRVLGAVRFLDATTGLRVTEPLRVTAAGVTWVRNRQNLYVIGAAPGLREHTQSFTAPPAQPPVGSVSVELTVADPARRYLARRCTVALPRDPDPAHADQAGSLFRPIDVLLYPSPAAATHLGWAVVRASVTAAGTIKELAGALIRALRKSDSTLLAGGMSDARGEALVGVPGIPVTTWGQGGGQVLTSEIDAVLEVVYDPAAGPSPDPDDLAARRATLPSSRTDVKLASGQVLVAKLSVTLP